MNGTKIYSSGAYYADLLWSKACGSIFHREKLVLPATFGSVGDPRSNPFSRNDYRDLKYVHELLNTLLVKGFLSPFGRPIQPVGKMDGYTIQAIQCFQDKMGIRGAERGGGFIQQDGETLKKLVEKANKLRWVSNPAFKGTFDSQTFFLLYQASFKTLSLEQCAGLEKLLGFLENDKDVTDLRWMAYMLATVKVECADTWQPIVEHGDKQYFLRRYDKSTKDLGNRGNGSDGFVFRGRGYVQLTGRKNYLNMGAKIGKNFDPEAGGDPELATDPETAYKIMSEGMRNGFFTTKGLPDYINGSKCDFVNARRIINGLDRASEIAGYASTFLNILQQSAI